ncbi:MAG: hypothetical protein U0V70_21175 [Terriglobia bacterium]
MTKTQPYRFPRLIRAASYFLLLFLGLSQFHSHLHGCDLKSLETRSWAKGTALSSSSPEGSNSPYGKVPPCLACNCQKLKVAFLPLPVSLARLIEIDRFSMERDRSCVRQTFSPIDLTRAPPQKG